MKTQRKCIYYENGKCAQMSYDKCDMTAKNEKKCCGYCSINMANAMR